MNEPNSGDNKPMMQQLSFPTRALCVLILGGCAADDGRLGGSEDALPTPTDTPAETETQSIDNGEEDAPLGENDKGLREKRCCVVKRYACDVGHPFCYPDSNPEVATYCNTMTGTAAGVRIACFGLGIAASSRVVRDGSCGRYNDCYGITY
jgi:hypothetical protein